ncbi:MAG: hypothetical protein RL036_555 [Actinomycetota bacterium]|jgi:hypothetical protein
MNAEDENLAKFHRLVEQRIGRNDYQANRCLICWSPEVTREHVIPQWLQRKERIYNSGLTRPGGTTTRFASVTVPLCAPCNNIHFGAIEKHVSKLVLEDHQIASEQDPIFQLWLTKVYYFVKIYEHLNPVYDRDLGQRRDFSEDEVRDVHLLSLKLREVGVDQVPAMPDANFASVWVLERQGKYESDGSHFAFFANNKVLGVSLGKFFVFAVLGDWGQYKRAGVLDQLPKTLEQVGFLVGCGLLCYLVDKNGVSPSFALIGDMENDTLTLSPNMIPFQEIDTTIGADFIAYLVEKFPGHFAESSSQDEGRP